MENEAIRRALDELMEGNRRFRGGAAAHPRQDRRRLAETAGAQRPFAAVVTCADSRVAPELLFDQGIGDLFVVRTAGGVLDAAGLGSVEYAVSHLGVRLVVVLGHTRCGAVQAALEGDGACGSSAFVVEALRPAVERARLGGGNVALEAVRGYVEETAARLASNGAALAPLVADGSAAVVGAVYDIESGGVEIVA